MAYAKGLLEILTAATVYNSTVNIRIEFNRFLM